MVIFAGQNGPMTMTTANPAMDEPVTLMTASARPARGADAPSAATRHLVPERNTSRSGLCGRRTGSDYLPRQRSEPDLCPECLAAAGG